MEVRLAVLSDYAAVTDEGKLVIAGIFDTISVSEIPTVHARVALALRIHLMPEEADEHDLRVQFVDADGNKILEFGGPIPAPPQVDMQNGADAQFVINFEPLPLQSYGQHAFEVFIDDTYSDAVVLNVMPMRSPAPESATLH